MQAEFKEDYSTPSPNIMKKSKIDLALTLLKNSHGLQNLDQFKKNIVKMAAIITIVQY